MNDDAVRTFRSALPVAIELVSCAAVAGAWHRPSALPGYTIGGLAAHLARAVHTVVDYALQGSEPDEPLADAAHLDAVTYFLDVLGDHDPRSSAFHESVRARGVLAAQGGPATVAHDLRAAVDDLADLTLDPDRSIEVIGGRRIRLAEYLDTRLVELALHGDDLATSVGLDSPPFDAQVWHRVATTLVGVVRARTGDRDLALSLARAERRPRPVAM